jgi:hypothetical protein
VGCGEVFGGLTCSNWYSILRTLPVEIEARRMAAIDTKRPLDMVEFRYVAAQSMKVGMTAIKVNEVADRRTAADDTGWIVRGSCPVWWPLRKAGHHTQMVPFYFSIQ